MTALILMLLCGAAHAETWAGVPLSALPSLGLGTPTLDAGRDAWRAPLADGGLVAVKRIPSEAQAAEGFDAYVLAAVSRPAPVLDLGDQAVGDGTGFVVVRYGNVWVEVVSDAGRAEEVARSVGAALVHTAPPGVVEVDGRRRDTVGRVLTR